MGDKASPQWRASKPSQQQGNRNRRRAIKKKPIVIRRQAPKFEGRCEELKGHIYDDCSDDDSRQAAVLLFRKTTKEIAEYVGRTYRYYGGDTRRAIENLVMPPPPDLPKDPADNATRTELRIWENEVDEYVKRETCMDENIRTLYDLVWGQCSFVMRMQIEALDTYDVLRRELQALELLKAIKSVLVFNVQSQKYPPVALHGALRRFYMLSQGKHTTCQAYLERFRNCVDEIEYYRGCLIKDILASDGKDLDTATTEELERAGEIAQEQYLATAFLLGSDRTPYGQLTVDLENDYTLGKDNYPKTVTEAYNRLLRTTGNKTRATQW
jgi:hypothetical protein